MENQIHNVNVVSRTVLPTPAAVTAELPITPDVKDTVLASRQAVQDILDGKDPRLFVVVGPCSIHDIDAAMDYAARLKKILTASLAFIWRDSARNSNRFEYDYCALSMDVKEKGVVRTWVFNGLCKFGIKPSRQEII